jgi:hypothetical protein
MRGPTPLRAGRGGSVAAVLVGAIAFVALIVATFAARPDVHIKVDADLSPLAHGFYPADLRDGITYAWTEPRAELTVPRLDRRVSWRLTGTSVLWRPAGSPPPVLRVAVDGVVAVERTLEQNIEPVDVVLPRRAEKSGVTLTFDTNPGFVANPAEHRELGVALETMTLTPIDGRPLPPWPAVMAGALAMLMLGAGLSLLPLSSLWLAALLVIAAIGQTWTFTRGLAIFGTYPRHVPTIAFWIAIGTVLVVQLIERVRGDRLSMPAFGVVTFSAVACYLKLLVLLHPGMPIGDGVFHAHRLEYVLAGRFYFTSVAPGDYAFPYPILLYLVSAPFSVLTSSTLDRVALLRVVVTVADATAGALLYWMVVGATRDRTAAVVSSVWYHLVPATSWIMTWGNLTNAFAQTLFVASLMTLVALPVDWAKRRSVLILAALSAAALLTHPSTCAILAIVLAATAVMYKWRGGERLRGAAVGVGVATLAAAVAAVLLYYAWFPAVYVRELSRAAAETAARTAQPATSLPGLSIADRFAMIPQLASQYFGWPAMVAAAVGIWQWKRGTDSRLTLLLAAWAGSSLVFLIAGLISPIQMRYHFAAFPAVALAAAFGWSWAWHGRLTMQIGATLLLAAAAWVGLQQWMALLT